MAEQKQQRTESWGSRVGMILAMAGNAVGLANFLRFPVIAIQNGGGSFLIPYLTCFLLMGVPLLWIEWAMGRFGGKFGNHSTPYILDTIGRGRLWKYIGVFGIFTNIAVASYYCYIESWALSYAFHSVGGSFFGMSDTEVANFFGTTYTGLEATDWGIPFESLIFFVLCLVLNTYILSRGLKGGIEKVAKFGMPMLLAFGAFLAYQGITLEAGSAGAQNPGTMGLNFLWKPDFSSIWNPSIWLAAAGQVFFTLSAGMGTVHCYASYLRSRDDIALNAMSAGWMNEFVEVVLGSAVLIPISVGYFGIDKVLEMVENGALGLGFSVLPYLFAQWGHIIGALGGLAFFGLLFFAGVTSSLAMGTPWMGFMQDEFNWPRERSAISFGVIIFLLGLPPVLFFQYGVMDEYDYWAGTVSLVVFAMLETIAFAWIFGITKAWNEINHGAELKVPGIYKYIIRYVTPTILILVFLMSVIEPRDLTEKEEQKYSGKVVAAFDRLSNGGDWELGASSIISKFTSAGINQKIAEAKKTGADNLGELQTKKTYLLVSRGLLLGVFVTISALVYIAYLKRRREGRTTGLDYQGEE